MIFGFITFLSSLPPTQHLSVSHTPITPSLKSQTLVNSFILGLKALPLFSVHMDKSQSIVTSLFFAFNFLDSFSFHSYSHIFHTLGWVFVTIFFTSEVLYTTLWLFIQVAHSFIPFTSVFWLHIESLSLTTLFFFSSLPGKSSLPLIPSSQIMLHINSPILLPKISYPKCPFFISLIWQISYLLSPL